MKQKGAFFPGLTALEAQGCSLRRPEKYAEALFNTLLPFTQHLASPCHFGSVRQGMRLGSTRKSDDLIRVKAEVCSERTAMGAVLLLNSRKQNIAEENVRQLGEMWNSSKLFGASTEFGRLSGESMMWDVWNEVLKPKEPMPNLNEYEQEVSAPEATKKVRAQAALSDFIM